MFLRSIFKKPLTRYKIEKRKHKEGEGKSKKAKIKEIDKKKGGIIFKVKTLVKQYPAKNKKLFIEERLYKALNKISDNPNLNIYQLLSHDWGIS